MKNSSFKKTMIDLGKNTSSGIVFGLGIMISIFGVVAFENLNSDPSTSGNQSLSSPILSKIAGTFDRDTMSLQALSEKIDSLTAGAVNYKDCEVKYLREDGNSTTNTLSCTAGYTIIDSTCAMKGSSYSTNAGHCYLTSNTTMEMKSFRRNNNGNRTYGRLGGAPSGSIKCCKYLVP